MPHTSDKLCYCVEAYIVNDNKVLLRIHDKYNFWNSIGGHIEPGEDPVQAVFREVQEEVGLPISLLSKPPFKALDSTKDLPAPQFINRHLLPDGHEHLVFIYVATTEKTEIRAEDGEPVAKCKWFTEEELNSKNSDLKDNVRFYALGALKMASK